MPQFAKPARFKHMASAERPLSTPGPATKSGAGPTRRRQRRPVRPDPTEGLGVVHPNAAAIDVGCTEHWVAVPPGRAAESVRRFGCCTADLEALADWLVECGVATVVMEATGNYWVVLYDLLESRGLNPVVVNPRYAKNMSGKKGDIPDCQWMQKLHAYGLFANSFRPGQSLRVLRTYLRQRELLVGALSEQIQHMQKALTEMNVQLANVISDISGETGLRIIDAILAGERDPQRLAALKNERIQASHQTLALALEGHWKEEQLFALEQARLTFSHFEEQLDQCQGRIEQQMREVESRLPAPGANPAVELATGANASASGPESPSGSQTIPAKSPVFDLKAELKRICGVDLTAIDGVGPVAAQVILSECGTDMSRWPSEKQFASWLGLCPDHRISGGKILGRSTRPVVSRARNALRLCAYALTNSQSWLGAKYRRLRYKLGAPKAIVAMAHHLARLIYRMIKYGQPYVDKGAQTYEQKYRAQRIKWLEKQANALKLKLVEA